MVRPEKSREKQKEKIVHSTKRKNTDNKNGKNYKKFIEFNNIDKAAETAYYYGFAPSGLPAIEKADIDNTFKILEEKSDRSVTGTSLAELETPLEEKNYLIRNYLEKNLIAEPQPIMISYRSPSSSGREKKINCDEKFLNLQMLGAPKSISEIILIKTAIAILNDNKIENICVDINSIGDRESINKLARELISYYRKHINKMPAHCRQLLKKDPFALLSCDKEDYCQTLNKEAPKALSFLSEQSRQHFKEILEGFELLGINYSINDRLVSDRRHCSQTVFRITGGDDKKKEILAYGSRYDGLAKRLGFRKDIPAVGIKINLKNLPNNPSINSKIKKPNCFFIQLGFEAKLKSLNTIEILRKAKIMVNQSLSKDMLGGQIALAEKLKVPYTLIIGKKESLENTVMVRDMNTRSQEVIPNDKLSEHLKKLI